MKAQYLIPTTEVVKVETYSLLQAISSVAGMKEGGQAGSGVKPQMPGRPIWF